MTDAQQKERALVASVFELKTTAVEIEFVSAFPKGAILNANLVTRKQNYLL